MKRVTATFVFEYDEDKHDDLTDENAKDMAQDTLLSNPEILYESLEVEDVDPDDVFFEEVMECPDCGGPVRMPEHIEVTPGGEGDASAVISCKDGCGFSAREIWTIDRTIRSE